MKKETEKDKYLLSSLNNALSLLDLLSHYKRLPLAQVAQLSGLDKSVAFRSLYTLEKNGYVEKDADGQYSLGIKFLYYGGLVLQRQDIIEIARPHLQSLALKCKIAAHLANLNDSRVVTIQKEESPYDIQVTARVGMNAPAHTTAMGRVLLAWTSEDQLSLILEQLQFKRYSPASLTTEGMLRQYLAQVRQQGFATDIDDRFPGFGSIACPVFDHVGHIKAAVGLVGLSQTILANQDFFRRELTSKALEISEALGYRPADRVPV